VYTLWPAVTAPPTTPVSRLSLFRFNGAKRILYYVSHYLRLAIVRAMAIEPDTGHGFNNLTQACEARLGRLGLRQGPKAGNP
jgi:hypothetical protein